MIPSFIFLSKYKKSLPNFQILRLQVTPGKLQNNQKVRVAKAKKIFTYNQNFLFPHNQTKNRGKRQKTVFIFAGVDDLVLFI